jgi:hypothetical protein
MVALIKGQADRCGAPSDVALATDGADDNRRQLALDHARWPRYLSCKASPGEFATFSPAGNTAWRELAGVSAQTSHRRGTDAHP